MPFPWILERMSDREAVESIEDHMREAGLDPDSKSDHIKFIDQSNRRAIEEGYPDSQLSYFDVDTREHYPKPTRMQQFFGFEEMDMSNDRVGQLGKELDPNEADLIQASGLDPNDQDDVDHFYMLEREAEYAGRAFEFRERDDKQTPKSSIKAG